MHGDPRSARCGASPWCTFSGQSVGEGVQPQGRRVLLRPEPQVLNAGGFTVQAWQGAGGLQDGGGPDLLSVGQRLVIGLTVQGAQRGHVDVHAQVGHGRRCPHFKGGVMDQVVGGCHVLAELLLQAEQAQGRGGVGVSLSQATAGRRRHSRAERGLCSRRQRGWGLFLQAA